MAIVDDIQTALDAAFASLGVAATYTPPAGSGVSVTVMPSQETETFGGPGGLQVDSDLAHFDVRVSDVATPVKSATLLVGETTYTVRHWSYRDPLRLVWTLECKG